MSLGFVAGFNQCSSRVVNQPYEHELSLHADGAFSSLLGHIERRGESLQREKIFLITIKCQGHGEMCMSLFFCSVMDSKYEVVNSLILAKI